MREHTHLAARSSRAEAGAYYRENREPRNNGEGGYIFFLASYWFIEVDHHIVRDRNWAFSVLDHYLGKELVIRRLCEIGISMMESSQEDIDLAIVHYLILRC